LIRDLAFEWRLGTGKAEEMQQKVVKGVEEKGSREMEDDVDGMTLRGE
jgi:hypothetical protein